MIHAIKLTRFKQFRETEVQLKPFSILMGENNSGKTTVLQALWLALSGLHQGKLISIDRKTLQTKVSSTGYPMYEIPFVPLGEYSGLFYKRIAREGQTYDENSGAFLQVTDDKRNSYRLHLRELFRNLNFKLMTPAQEIHNPTIQNYAPLYIAGFSGLHFQEERMFPAILEAKMAAGDVNAIIRNIVLDMKLHEPEKYHYLETLLDEEFDFHIKEIRFQENDERYVFAEYEERTKLDAVGLEFGSSGSGIMQILQIIAVILRYCPEKTKVVLIDEPEAHLHENLQIKFAEILKKIQQELGIQVILATHSSAIIRNADPEDVIPVLPYASVNKPLRCWKPNDGDSTECILAEIEASEIGKMDAAGTATAGSASSEFCELDAYEIAKAKISGKLAFLEKGSIGFLKQKAKELRVDCFSGMNTVPVIPGWRMGDDTPFEMSRILRKMTGRTIEIHLVCKKESLSDAEQETLQKQAADAGTVLHLISEEMTSEETGEVLAGLKANVKVYREEEQQTEEQQAEQQSYRRDYEQLTLLDL